MLDRTRSLVAVRLIAGAAIVALAVAACGGSSATPTPAGSAAAPTQAAGAATPAPTQPPQEHASEPAESAEAGESGGGTAGGCADMAAVATAMKNVDHYVATAKIGVAMPGASADAGLSMDMVMKFQKPDRYEISTGLGGGVLFAMKQVGKESWLQMFGADTWTKSDASSGSAEADPNLLGNLQSAGLEPLAQIPAELDLPGSSSCVVGYTMKLPTGAAGDSSNPLSSLSSASAIALRVDTATGLPESMGFLIDTATAGAGAPTSMVFVFDYQTPVDIQAPDPSLVTEGGSLDGFPLPSGMELPSGLTLP